jgi:hypothetical protein
MLNTSLREESVFSEFSVVSQWELYSVKEESSFEFNLYNWEEMQGGYAVEPKLDCPHFAQNFNASLEPDGESF